MPGARAVLCLSLFLSSGCGAGWHRVEATPESRFDPATQFLVHHGGTVDRWHAVRISADAVSGISWMAPVDCDSCRVATPRAAVDSIREGHPTAGLWKGVGLAFGSLAVFCAIACPKGD